MYPSQESQVTAISELINNNASQTPERTKAVQRAESLSCKVAKPRPDVSDLKKKKMRWEGKDSRSWIL